jgi:hypothetical protein
MYGLITWEDSKAGNYDLLVWPIHITGPILKKSALQMAALYTRTFSIKCKRVCVIGAGKLQYAGLFSGFRVVKTLINRGGVLRRT